MCSVDGTVNRPWPFKLMQYSNRKFRGIQIRKRLSIIHEKLLK